MGDEQNQPQQEVMTPQSILHELGKLVRMFEVFKSGESVMMSLIDAENKAAALQKANGELGAAVEAIKKELAGFQGEQKAARKAWEVERAAFLEETAKQCEKKKAGYQEELASLGDEVKEARADLARAKADLDQFRSEQNTHLSELNARADEAEGRLRAANEAMAELKGKL